MMKQLWVLICVAMLLLACGDEDKNTIDTPSKTAPTTLSLVEVTASSISLTWQDNSNDEEGFGIEVSTDGGQSFSPLDTVAADTTTYTHDGLDAQTTYHYRVYAYLGAQSSDYSNVLEATTTNSGDLFTLPAERVTRWQPGVTYNGGIPHRTDVCATLSPLGGGASDTAQIQDAIDTCPDEGVVQLSAGTFTIGSNASGGIFIRRSNVTLRGTLDENGDPATVLVCQAERACGSIIVVGTLWVHPGDSVDVTVDVVKESYTATVASDPGFEVGELVIVDETTDDTLTWWAPRCSPGGGNYPGCRTWFIRQDRPIGQVNEITAIDGTTLTFAAPFHMGFRTSHAAQVTRFNQAHGHTPTTRVGVEDLKVSGGSGGDGGGNIHIFAATYSWLRNVEADQSAGTSVNFDGAFRCELRDSYVHSTINATPGGDGYGIGMNFYAADNLVENSISWNFNKVILMRASGGGNVVGYSYFDDGWIAYNPLFVESGLNSSHYATSHMELFEGNLAFNFASDSTWGNSIYITAFRNHLTGLRGGYPPLDEYTYDTLHYEDLQNRFAIDVGMYHYWSSFVGNVLGYEGMTPISDPVTHGYGVQNSFVYEYNGAWDAVPMWRVGLLNDGTQEPTTVATLIRHGNFDWVTESQVWDDDFSNQNLPASLYMSGKPAFMRGEAWPWVDPATGATGELPAKARFDRIHGLP
jgi:hypothetical protein